MLPKDFEALVKTATAWLMLASVALLLRSLAGGGEINLLDIGSGSKGQGFQVQLAVRFSK